MPPLHVSARSVNPVAGGRDPLARESAGGAEVATCSRVICVICTTNSAAASTLRTQHALLVARADDLRMLRQTQIAEHDFHALSTDFEVAVRVCRPRVANMGSIVVADELSGIDAALSSLSNWTHVRFGADRVAAFAATVNAARAASARGANSCRRHADQPQT